MSDKQGVSAFFGTWPGDESDAELLKQLAEVRQPTVERQEVKLPPHVETEGDRTSAKLMVVSYNGPAKEAAYTFARQLISERYYKLKALELLDSALRTISSLEGEIARLREELAIAYRSVQSATSLIDLAYMDADGETPNPRTWKEEAQELEAENAALKAQGTFDEWWAVNEPSEHYRDMRAMAEAAWNASRTAQPDTEDKG